MNDPNNELTDLTEQEKNKIVTLVRLVEEYKIMKFVDISKLNTLNKELNSVFKDIQDTIPQNIIFKKYRDIIKQAQATMRKIDIDIRNYSKYSGIGLTEKIADMKDAFDAAGLVFHDLNRISPGRDTCLCTFVDCRGPLFDLIGQRNQLDSPFVEGFGQTVNVEFSFLRDTCEITDFSTQTLTGALDRFDRRSGR